jgi:hypothetical protein
VGYGVPNVMKAVGGMYDAWISEDILELQECAYVVYELRGLKIGGDGPFSYQWGHGPTTEAVTDTLAVGVSRYRSVQITDTSDGTTRSAYSDIHGPAWCGPDPLSIPPSGS